jgi:hypothetical protein
VISSDEIAYSICDELSRSVASATDGATQTVTYANVWSLHGDRIERVYSAKVNDAVADARTTAGVVIVDRTFTSVARRREALHIIREAAPESRVVCVHFIVNDEALYERNLALRNAALPDKQITAAILANIRTGAVSPVIDEGFEVILRCPAVLERDWESSFGAAARSVLEMLL